MVIDRDRLEGRLQKWSSGSMVMAALVALLVGMFLGAVLF